MSDIHEPEIPEEPSNEPIESAAPEESPTVPEAGDAPAAEPEEKTVPLAALNEARHTNRELREKYDQLEGQFKTFLEQQRESSRQTEQESAQEAFNRDPLGAIQKDIQSLRDAQEASEKASQDEREQSAQLAQLEQAVAVQITDFSKDHGDYPDALNHLLASRSQELRMMGYPEDQIQVLIQQESVGIAQTALRTGGSAPEMVYNLAKMRGYAPKQSETGAKLDNVAKGQEKAGTMPAGEAASPDVTLADIEKMSDEEFDKYWNEEVAQ